DMPPSLHKYLYAYQNPTVYVDPDGRRACGAREIANDCDEGTGLRNNSAQYKNIRDQQAATADLVERKAANAAFIESNTCKEGVCTELTMGLEADARLARDIKETMSSTGWVTESSSKPGVESGVE